VWEWVSRQVHLPLLEINSAFPGRSLGGRFEAASGRCSWKGQRRGKEAKNQGVLAGWGKWIEAGAHAGGRL
jgi:hypothetical protein